MARLFLHIGTHKTGTSALQAVLRSGRRALRREGIGVVRRLPGDAAIMRLEEPSEDLAGPARRALLKAIDRHPRRVEQFVLSFEGFSGNPYRAYQNTASVAEVVSRITDGIPTVVVVYLRRQDQFAESLYAQSIHEGGSLSFDAFLASLGSARLDWSALLLAYESRFGAENLRVRPYTPARFSPASSLVHDFGRVIGSGYLLSLDSSPRVNPSYSRAAIEVARLCNETLPAAEREKLRRILQATHPREAASLSFFSTDARAAFLAEHRESNERVAERYLAPGVPLFDPPAGEQEESPAFDAAALSRVVSRVLLSERERQPRAVRFIAGAGENAETFARRLWRGLRRVSGVD